MQVEYNLDVLKPHSPSNDLLARTLITLKGVKSVCIKVDEIDQNTTSVFIEIIGDGDLDLEDIKSTLEAHNSALHSVDMVKCQNE